MSVVGVSDLIERRHKITSSKTIFVPELEKEIEIRKLHVTRYAQIIDSADSESAENTVRSELKLIYESCPVFQSRELQEVYSCVMPEDVVADVLNQNLEAIHEITAEINALYKNAKDELKN